MRWNALWVWRSTMTQLPVQKNKLWHTTTHNALRSAARMLTSSYPRHWVI
jgi:hypothetical protein